LAELFAQARWRTLAKTMALSYRSGVYCASGVETKRDARQHFMRDKEEG